MAQQHTARTILLSTALYFAICGLSAILAPSLWLWASGLPTPISNELGLAFGVVGAYLSAFSVGALIASLEPRSHSGLILTLIAGNVFDFIVTLRAVVAGSLPTVNGAIFVAVTIIWSTLLTIAWFESRRRAA
jgi:hypothetical protein